jgi:hypothetical protein
MLVTISRPAPLSDLPDPIRLVIEALPRDPGYVQVQDNPNVGEPAHRDWIAEIVLCGHRIQLRHWTRPDLPDLSVLFDGKGLFSVSGPSTADMAPVWAKTIVDKVRDANERSHRANTIAITAPDAT